MEVLAYILNFDQTTTLSQSIHDVNIFIIPLIQLHEKSRKDHATLHVCLAEALATALQGHRSPVALDPWLDMASDVKGHGQVLESPTAILCLLLEQYQTTIKREVKEVR